MGVPGIIPILDAIPIIDAGNSSCHIDDTATPPQLIWLVSMTSDTSPKNIVDIVFLQRRGVVEYGKKRSDPEEDNGQER